MSNISHPRITATGQIPVYDRVRCTSCSEIMSLQVEPGATPGCQWNRCDCDLISQLQPQNSFHFEWFLLEIIRRHLFPKEVLVSDVQKFKSGHHEKKQKNPLHCADTPFNQCNTERFNFYINTGKTTELLGQKTCLRMYVVSQPEGWGFDFRLCTCGSLGMTL